MKRLLNAVYFGGRTGHWLRIGSLVMLSCLILPTSALASASDPLFQGPDTCAQCHPAEAKTWQESPHAYASGTQADTDVTCEACHGPYVSGHPEEGMMKLPTDGSCCEECHTTTYQEWHETAHAGSGVQCTSCHVSHSQKTRLAGEDLCASCHRDIVDDWAHSSADVHCTDCHLPAPAIPDSTADVQVAAGVAAPDHNFEHPAESCGGCHGQTIHALNVSTVQTGCEQLPALTQRVKDLAIETEEAKRTNRNLQAMSVVSLGFGLGAGGVLGVMLMLVVGYVGQRRTDR